jgi:hypothetical protein
MQGALVRTFVKDDPMTSLDWDLTKPYRNSNFRRSCTLFTLRFRSLMQAEMSTYEEKILKWYGVLRQPDLDNL